MSALALSPTDSDEFEVLKPPPITKKLFRTVETCAPDALEGLINVHCGLRLVGKTLNVVRENLHELRGKVAVVAGGGSGHEPYPAGFVAKGMLAGAAPGKVFASPPAPQVLPLFQLLWTAGVSGILVFVINSPGGCLNFGLAVEKAQRAGIKITPYICGDDCAVTNFGVAGRRGLAGCVLLVKVACAMADEGFPLHEIVRELEVAGGSLGTIGVCLYPCSLPGQPPVFQLAADEFELGSGIHGEAGVSEVKMQPVQGIISTMISHMTDRSNPSRLELEPADEVALLINNLGGTSVMEEYIVCLHTIKHLEARQVKIVRAFSGRVMTSLDMAGVQITLLRLGNDPDRRRRWLRLLDAPTKAPGWPKVVKAAQFRDRFTPPKLPAPKVPELNKKGADDVILTFSDDAARLFDACLREVDQALQRKEATLNEMDSGAGDGDCGTTLVRGMKAVIQGVDNGTIKLRHPQMALSAMSDICGLAMGGASGALYSLMFAGAANSMLQYEKHNVDDKRANKDRHVQFETDKDAIQVWIEAFSAGVFNMSKYGGAGIGDRTMMDALLPALHILRAWRESSTPFINLMRQAAAAAQRGAAKTIQMVAKLGRASYVDPNKVVHPDPGAIGVSIWFRTICQTLAAPIGSARPETKGVQIFS